MSNPFKLIVTLKQHSPLIHFQSDQAGATLRSTELKPKLDKFLIDEVFDDFEEYKKFLIEHDEEKYKALNGQDKKKYKNDIHKALDYKVRISVEPGKVETKKVPIITMDKTTVYYPSHSLEIFSFKTELLDKIKEVIEKFFILHNFGLRQSKGFGCFTTGDTTQAGFENSALSKYPVYYRKKPSGSNIYNEIDMDYKIMKSGINHNKYIKSKLFRYLSEEKHIDWEKRKIKETLKTRYKDVFDSLKYRSEDGPQRIAKSLPEKETPNFRYIRALLGLAEHNEFRTWKGKIQVNIEDNKEKDDKDRIERFQSPLMFKVFNQHIYIFPNEIPDEMYNREFKFSLDNKRLFTIPTPLKSDFNMISFLDFCLINNNDLKNWERISKK